LRNPNYRFYGACGSFIAAYLLILNKAKKSNNEAFRLGASGSIAVLSVESTFYFLDTINIR
jgi:hypothetical protein